MVGNSERAVAPTSSFFYIFLFSGMATVLNIRSFLLSMLCFPNGVVCSARQGNTEKSTGDACQCFKKKLAKLVSSFRGCRTYAKLNVQSLLLNNHQAPKLHALLLNKHQAPKLLALLLSKHQASKIARVAAEQSLSTKVA